MKRGIPKSRPRRAAQIQSIRSQIRRDKLLAKRVAKQLISQGAMELKYYDTSLVSSALTKPTDASGGEHDPATILTISAPVGS